MEYLDPTSLFKTIDNVSEAILFDLDIADDEKLQVAEFICEQQDNPNSYGNTFAPTDFDLKRDLVLFTGEKVKSRVGKCHMIGEEASRILRKMKLNNARVNDALNKADKGLQNFIDSWSKNPKYEYGIYCCKLCSCALWINLASGGIYTDFSMLQSGLGYLKKHRDGNGKWTGFPYYYTIYVLNEIQDGFAKEELVYCAASIERRLKKKRKEETKFDLRRNYICEQILDKINSN